MKESAGGGIRGRYRDRLHDEAGSLLRDSGWRDNLIVDSAWRLVASLMVRDPRAGGIGFWAVGEGDPDWDGVRIAPRRGADRLHAEMDRIEVTREDFQYLDGRGRPTSRPTFEVELTGRFRWPEASHTLREFGVFGGEAGEAPGSGTLVNLVIHPRLEVPAGATLVRRLRLSFLPEEQSRWLEVPRHWLGREGVTVVDGVGEVFTEALDRAGVRTVSHLAALEPMEHEGVLPFVRLVELRAKARLLLRAASELRAGAGFHRMTGWEIIVTPTLRLAAEAGASPEEAARVREKVSALELTLDHPFLRQITVGELLAEG